MKHSGSMNRCNMERKIDLGNVSKEQSVCPNCSRLSSLILLLWINVICIWVSGIYICQFFL